MSMVSIPIIFSPRNSISPPEALTRPAIALSVVLLPAPLAPINVTIDFSGTSKEIPLTAEIPP